MRPDPANAFYIFQGMEVMALNICFCRSEMLQQDFRMNASHLGNPGETDQIRKIGMQC